MCPFCWTAIAMVTVGVASTGAVGAVLAEVGLVRRKRMQADMDGTGSESTEYNERRRGNDECN